MTVAVESRDRQILPRWRSSLIASQSGELASLFSAAPVAIKSSVFRLKEKLDDWRHNRSLPFAGEALSAAIASGGVTEAREISRFLLSESLALPRSLRRLAESVEGVSASRKRSALTLLPPSGAIQWSKPIESSRPRLVQLKLAVRESPRNAIAWVNLALEHASVGQTSKARKEIAIALSLAPNDRFVLRSAARFYVHDNDTDRGLWVLRKSPSTPTDSWLLAAEISLSSLLGESSRFVKAARRLNGSEKLSSFHLSEMRSALATLELRDGAHRTSKKLFHLSLNEPTENAVAQAEWASHKLGSPIIDQHHLATPRSFEARAKLLLKQGKWREALNTIWSWLDDQPFSKEPAVLGSYAASLGLHDDEESVRISTAGLVANPNETFLLNNLAFALAGLGQLDEAEEALKRISPDSPNALYSSKATEGMIAYRRGRLEVGRERYLEALSFFTVTGQRKPLAIASICWAREATLARAHHRTEALKLVSDTTKGIDDPEVIAWADLLSEAKVE